MKKLMLALALITPVTAMAKSADLRPLGAQTRAWLELQKSGNAAVATPRPMSGEVADRVYDRYLKSFSHPIPATYSRERFLSEGGGN